MPNHKSSGCHGCRSIGLQREMGCQMSAAKRYWDARDEDAKALQDALAALRAHLHQQSEAASVMADLIAANMMQELHKPAPVYVDDIFDILDRVDHRSTQQEVA